ncbi:MAG: hypothetical protein E7436_07040 [Ruminococcaceae bacterium]|nr:hypothetical protein [Oscillospiraceae bacterium]
MLYLAMTAGEFHSCRELPEKIAWMACHFSPYGTGLTNLPRKLPAGSLLILNDRTPVHGHDAGLIRETLAEVVEEQNCGGLLLDLQRPGCAEAAEVVRALVDLPCPVAVSAPYALEDGAVFLPPVPMLTPLETYLEPWRGRTIWLDLAPETTAVTVTESGTTIQPHPGRDLPPMPHRDDELRLHYGLELSPEAARFTLRRTRADLEDLLEKGKAHGVTTAVGLYQELSY